MKTWAQLLAEHPEVATPLSHWWLSDYTHSSLTGLPLQAACSPAEEEAFSKAAQRLKNGEPVQYVCGRAPFRDLELKVDARVLIPRPETEQLVQIALERLIRPGDRILDVGTGSGCIALSLKKARPDCRVEGLDISEQALTVARENAEALSLDVSFRQADLLTGEPFRSQELIIANLPYVGENEKAALPADVRNFEPALALFAGPEGTDLILKLLEQARDVLTPGGHLLLETGETQGPCWREAGNRPGWRVEGLRDLAGRERFWIFGLAASADVEA